MINMLSKPFYESLPYLYLAFGYGLITFDPSFFTSISGGFFFLIGALVWNIRSHFRRSDHEYARQNTDRNKIIYDLKPFACFLCGILVVTWIDNKIAAVFAFVLCIMAGWILFLRLSNRYTRKKKRKTRNNNKYFSS